KSLLTRQTPDDASGIVHFSNQGHEFERILQFDHGVDQIRLTFQIEVAVVGMAICPLDGGIWYADARLAFAEFDSHVPVRPSIRLECQYGHSETPTAIHPNVTLSLSAVPVNANEAKCSQF